LELSVPSSILADTAVSVTELKKNPMASVAAGEGFPVAVLNHNEPAFYCVPAAAWELLLDRLEDAELNAIANARADDPEIEIDIDQL
jgi:antitoxin StbD